MNFKIFGLSVHTGCDILVLYNVLVLWSKVMFRTFKVICLFKATCREIMWISKNPLIQKWNLRPDQKLRKIKLEVKKHQLIWYQIIYRVYSKIQWKTFLNKIETKCKVRNPVFTYIEYQSVSRKGNY